ncbi:CAAX prenyl protease 2 isoform X2 [Sitophilus oryzae]|uniref:CAAX prenyl protease 2 n=1 Tax=Sitophilus oryzae TaxID=7048 RepID=A0A6J2XRF1_SITOR|nr:CAAX prenyl protease 2 isoform X2 [Sitophilus oryzae]
MELLGSRTIFECFMSIGTCFMLSVAYLGSLHVWKSQYNRDHPTTIRQRFLSVFVMFFLSPVFLYVGLNKDVLEKVSLAEVLGLRTKGLLQAFFMPLFLTMILFLGPISMELYSGIAKLYTESYWYSNFTNLIWLRSHLVAPLSEEFTYRSCMLPLLLQCLPPLTAVLVNPLFFGVAHFHHMQERIRFGLDFRTAFKISCFQFGYTTIFGAYSAYIFYRTGHFVSVFVVHAFCNHMGFPDVVEVAGYKRTKKIAVVSLFFLGFFCWCALLKPLTEPSWYYNKNPWYSG